MNKKVFVGVLFVLVLFTLGFSAAQEADNSTVDDSISDEVLTADEVNGAESEVLSIGDSQVLKANEDNGTALKASSKLETHIDVKSNETLDAIGDYFKIRLSDENKDSLGNAKVTFTINGVSYDRNTDSSGIASLQIRLKDGTYKIVTKYGGDSNHKSTSLTATFKMNNTRVVDAGLTNSEIQNIIDNARDNNVILFMGSSYSNINLVVTKSLTLMSNVGTTLVSGSANPVITVKGSKASLSKIKGFNIKGNGNGIEVNDANYVTVYGNTITSCKNGIVAVGTKYLNITKNDISQNSKSGIVLADAVSSYIFDNSINKNGGNGIELANSNKVYIHGNTISNNDGNGIYVTDKVNGKNYGSESENLYISSNAIYKNDLNGIFIHKAGNNVNVLENSISENDESGILISKIGNNKIQSNELSRNRNCGLRFDSDYIQPKTQDISYNAFVRNGDLQIEAKDTLYDENGNQVPLGDNWFSDRSLICPKVGVGKITFSVRQIGENKFQAVFLDSDGNVASMLPDRILTYSTNNGQEFTITVSGGAGVFEVDAENGDLVRATVDLSKRDNIYNSDASESDPINGQPHSYSYPAIPDYEINEDIDNGYVDDGYIADVDDVNGNNDNNGNGNGGGNGNGNGNGQGNNGNANKGNGNSEQGSSENTGNSTISQKTDPGKASGSPINDVSQSYQSDVTTSPESASLTSTGNTADSNSGTKPESVVKQIVIDEDEFYKITGISFIILLILLTVSYYYKDDIREMKSKM
jgi:parallel beta-helix repeat protein